MNNTERFIAAWSALTPAEQLKYTVELNLLKFLLSAAAWAGNMKQRNRLILIVAAVAYAAFFLWLSERYAQVSFAAGILLGAVLVAAWLLSVLRRK